VNEEDTRIERIASSELRVGMYIQKLGSSWWKHPFLRGSFLLTDPADIAAIIDSGISEVWIDPSKEVAPEPEPVVQSTRRETAGARSIPGATSAPPAPPVKKSNRSAAMAAELARAKDICVAAKGQMVDMFHAARLGKAIDPGAADSLVEEIAASIERHPAALLSVARLKTHDDYTYLHSVAVSALMLSLARQLELDARQTRLAGIGGLMHDLGKAAMPREVLRKPGKLTDDEFAIVKRHPAEGAEMLRAGGADPEVIAIALHHQEKIDGTGYPGGLAGDAIPLLARMGAVCDVYDAVTSERVYKKPWDPSGAMRQMAKWDGHFDKVIFNAFVKTVGIYPVGSLVRLASHRLAVVVEPGTESLLKPRVRVFFSVRSNEPVMMETVDLAARACNDRIVQPEDPDKWGFRSLEHLWMP
jgi:putative nucleotidyltransferase with HDIG domain